MSNKPKILQVQTLAGLSALQCFHNLFPGAVLETAPARNGTAGQRSVSAVTRLTHAVWRLSYKETLLRVEFSACQPTADAYAITVNCDATVSPADRDIPAGFVAVILLLSRSAILYRRAKPMLPLGTRTLIIRFLIEDETFDECVEDGQILSFIELPRGAEVVSFLDEEGTLDLLFEYKLISLPQLEALRANEDGRGLCLTEPRLQLGPEDLLALLRNVDE